MPRFSAASIHIGTNRNAFQISIWACIALREAGATVCDRLEYLEASVTTDFETFLRVTREWVNVE